MISLLISKPLTVLHCMSETAVGVIGVDAMAADAIEVSRPRNTYNSKWAEFARDSRASGHCRDNNVPSWPPVIETWCCSRLECLDFTPSKMNKVGFILGPYLEPNLQMTHYLVATRYIPQESRRALWVLHARH